MGGNVYSTPATRDLANLVDDGFRPHTGPRRGVPFAAGGEERGKNSTWKPLYDDLDVVKNDGMLCHQSIIIGR